MRFYGFWWFSLEFLKAFEYFWLFSLHAFFHGIHVFDVILRIVDCFWWFFRVFLTIFKGFERFSVHFEGFLRCLMFFKYSQLFFMIFYVFLMSLYVFYTIFDDCWRIFDGQCCFFRYFLGILKGLASFWRN